MEIKYEDDTRPIHIQTTETDLKILFKVIGSTSSEFRNEQTPLTLSEENRFMNMYREMKSFFRKG